MLVHAIWYHHVTFLTINSKILSHIHVLCTCVVFFWVEVYPVGNIQSHMVHIFLLRLFPMGDMPEILHTLIAKGRAILWSSQEKEGYRVRYHE